MSYRRSSSEIYPLVLQVFLDLLLVTNWPFQIEAFAELMLYQLYSVLDHNHRFLKLRDCLLCILVSLRMLAIFVQDCTNVKYGGG